MTKRQKIDLAAMLETSDCRAEALRTLREGLNATRSFNQNGETVTEPDFKTRVRAAEILLGYTDGKPIERQQVLVSQVESQQTDEEYAEGIARALRLPPGYGKKVLDRVERENRASTNPAEHQQTEPSFPEQD